MNGLIEPVAPSDFRDDFRVQTSAAAIITVADVTNAGLRMAGANAFATRASNAPLCPNSMAATACSTGPPGQFAR